MAEIHDYTLRQTTIDILNRQLKSGINDAKLIELVLALRDEDRLVIKNEKEKAQNDMRIICSMGLRGAA